MNDESRRLVPLGEARGFGVRAGMPDVRGWDVIGGDGARVGRVSELMVDPDAGRVRYLEVETGESGGARRRVHVPIGLARLDAERDAVLVPAVTTTTMSALTTAQADTITREYEVHVRRSLGGAEPDIEPVAPDADPRFYEHEHYDERRFAGARRGSSGRRAEDRGEGERADDGDEDFGYLAGVGGAMTDADERPEVVGELAAGEISVPVMQEETDARVAPEEGTAPAQEGDGTLRG